jgi:hypothetical protein
MVALFSGALLLEVASEDEVHAQSLMQESQSSSTSCIKGQPCQTMICSDTQPCQIIQSPNGGFDADKSSVHTTPEDPILMIPNPYVSQPSID